MDKKRLDQVREHMRKARQREGKKLLRRKLTLYGLYALAVAAALFVMLQQYKIISLLQHNVIMQLTNQC